MTSADRDVLERAIRRVTEQAANADVIVHEPMDAGLDSSDPVTVHVKQLRAELLSVKGDLERELERVVLDCTVCGRTVHFVGGLGVRAGHWAPPTSTSRNGAFHLRAAMGESPGHANLSALSYRLARAVRRLPPDYF